MAVSIFTSPPLIITLSLALRVTLLIYGSWQDAVSPVKYTDIDYLVFTDAARYVSQGLSPYSRDTYRYTPLLAWLLVPTTWNVAGFSLFSFGKVLFAAADVVAGWLVAKCLRTHYGMDTGRAMKFACVWLLNPMVANISTRGSSEGLLGVLVAGVLWAALSRRVVVAGMLLGLGVHFKIYPFVYGVSILWWLGASTSSKDSDKDKGSNGKEKTIPQSITGFITPSRILLTLTALTTFLALNITMYTLYGNPFLQHTYLHHLTRIDHRHNFSPYSTLLYLASVDGGNGYGYRFESLAFIPQILLSVVVIPVVLAKRDLAGAMLAQTFAFVGFNKVCTSQYFLWYLIFLPFYLPNSSLLKKPQLGLLVAALWVIAQALWLHQGFRLEFLGISSFVPGLFLAGLFFYVVNCWILGILIQDAGGLSAQEQVAK
ncbi:glycosylphosphatidylinositol-alpha 1,4 mannosyltransferase I [Aspergillus ruber CBS 135680]|uniref:GPI mannosyltransferase 1 n=1 Tax=Aspergillus ruber (strain CBS 135680) TaxID=1388766 RepID=A0A017SD90_ASPRC|nr:GPI mannosyltransferase [Aspergillus ruber CBS 135680]EYE94983.1 GPI mannosyltransferase [Aspergillus ruber CBS 135680]